MDDLEKEKLKAEIREIKLRVATERNRINVEKKRGFKFIKFLRNWAAVIIAFITIITGSLTIGTKIYTFLKEKEIAQDVKVGKQMRELVDDLGSKDKNREYTAILLSAYEERAIPILLMSLRTGSPESITEALRLIKEKVKPKVVIDPLIESTKRAFSQEHRKNDTKYQTSIKNHLYALGELGKEKEGDIVVLLENLEERIEEDSELTGGNKTIIKKDITKTSNKLKE